MNTNLSDVVDTSCMTLSQLTPSPLCRGNPDRNLAGFGYSHTRMLPFLPYMCTPSL